MRRHLTDHDLVLGRAGCRAWKIEDDGDHGDNDKGEDGCGCQDVGSGCIEVDDCRFGRAIAAQDEEWERESVPEERPDRIELVIEMESGADFWTGARGFDIVEELGELKDDRRGSHEDAKVSSTLPRHSHELDRSTCEELHRYLNLEVRVVDHPSSRHLDDSDYDRSGNPCLEKLRTQPGHCVLGVADRSDEMVPVECLLGGEDRLKGVAGVEADGEGGIIALVFRGEKCRGPRPGAPGAKSDPAELILDI